MINFNKLKDIVNVIFAQQQIGEDIAWFGTINQALTDESIKKRISLTFTRVLLGKAN